MIPTAAVCWISSMPLSSELTASLIQSLRNPSYFFRLSSTDNGADLMPALVADSTGIDVQAMQHFIIHDLQDV